ncbi:alpha/beta fold hydrolase [Streptomyces sp. NPDC021139]|uniref:alpha/beta fold hydrolase n=1 Tax=unclassified Streptomyces TaxID=2593676 RepID=UPI0033E309D3
MKDSRNGPLPCRTASSSGWPYAGGPAVARTGERHATHAGFRPGILDAFLAPWRGEAGQAAFYRQYSQIRQADTVAYEHLLGGVSIPVRLVWGREDRILPPQYAEWLHERVPHAELHWIEDAGHLLQEDAPGQLLACLAPGFASAPVAERPNG